MHEEKAALLQKYYYLTLNLVNEIDNAAIQALLDERQTYIEKINQLDQSAGQILMNSALKDQVRQIQILETALQKKLKSEQQKILGNIHSLRKEKKIKLQYDEPALASSGLFYDKRK
ncbi:hypothetical protein V7161_25745 [Neobacillus drentensis]|uniref:hypothetical protein n=1 Tax=Neobacillus drentensis TaxID=220684 RepID=UPI003002231B